MIEFDREPSPQITNVREIDFLKDSEPLRAILEQDEIVILDKLEPFVSSGGASCFVLEQGGELLGWVVLHLKYNADYGWVEDADTEFFQSEENCYLGNIVVSKESRRLGVGALLLKRAFEVASAQNQKMMWLHVSDQNISAIKFYENQGWSYRNMVTPEWYDGKPMRIYYKPVS